MADEHQTSCIHYAFVIKATFRLRFIVGFMGKLYVMKKKIIIPNLLLV